MDAKITRSIRIALVALAAMAVVLTAAGPASAKKVQSPGAIKFQFNDGSMKVGSQVMDASPDGSDPITFSGTIDAAGNVNIPESSIVFPPVPVQAGAYNVLVRILPVGPATGVLNPITGATTLTARFYVKIDGVPGSSNCRIGGTTTSTALVLNLTSGTSGTQTGVPYNPATGLVTLVDGLFAVPASSDCGVAASSINSQLGLPSPSGNNYAVLTALAIPAPQPALVARFNATPSSGTAPLDVSFNASTSTVSTATATYRWDFDNNGTTDLTSASPTGASHTYVIPGNYTAKLSITDSDGDVATTTRQIVALAPAPDVSVAVAAESPPFVTGVVETYRNTVRNDGTLATSDPITFSQTVPAGGTYAGFEGTGWTCNSAPPLVSCEYAGSLAAGEAAPDLLVKMTFDDSAVGFVATTSSVETAGDDNDSNDSASIVTEVIRAGIDLAILKTHDGQDGLLRGRRASYYLDVKNVGTEGAGGRVVVTDNLPDGVTFVGASGVGWTCSFTAPTVRCFTDDDVAPGQALPRLTIRVDVDTDAGNTLSNTGRVSTPGDTGADNDSSTDLGTVLGYAADFSITKHHSGDFVLGQPGAYTIKVKNVGTKTSGGGVTITDELPDGLTPVAAEGTPDPDDRDWSCNITGQTVKCTHPGPVEPGVELEAVTVGVTVGGASAGDVVNVATLTSPDDFNGENDSASDPTRVRNPLPDLAMDKSHAATRFTVGQQGIYKLKVTNAGPEPSRGTITVTDTLPNGLAFVSATGSDWSCGATGAAVTCTRTTAIGPGDSSEITLTVAVGDAAVPGVTNVARVAVANDTNGANDEDTDPTAVARPPLATQLRANGALLTLLREEAGIAHGLNGLVATLRTSSGAPIADRRISFKTADGTLLCDAQTNGSGQARCGTVLISIQAALGNQYRAEFAGDDTYAPSSGIGGIVQVGPLVI
jgi:uncharacterized repeat protein (TIGR01451 family)